MSDEGSNPRLTQRDPGKPSSRDPAGKRPTPEPPRPKGSSGGLRKQVELPSKLTGSKPRARPEDPDGDEAATHPGAPARRSTPLSGGLGGGGMLGLGPRRSMTPDDDPVTVRADRRGLNALDSDTDPATVQRFMSGSPSRPRIAASFMGESVMDPETVFDQADAGRWREEIEAGYTDDHIDELPPGPLPPGPLPSSFAERSGPTLAREIPAAVNRGSLPRHAEEPHESRVTVMLPLLAGAAGGVLILALVMAWLAGSP